LKRYFFALTLACSAAAIAQVPDAPTVQPFFHNNTNRALVAAELNIRLLDAISTRQGITASCRCHPETSQMFGVSLAPIAASSAAQYSYSIGVAAAYVGVSALTWKHAAHSRHPKLYRGIARGILMFDASYDAYVGPINNWMQPNKAGTWTGK
jgi:hypothetical protein